MFQCNRSSQAYLKLIKKYKIKSIEDPFAEDDWGAWNKLFSRKKWKKFK